MEAQDKVAWPMVLDFDVSSPGEALLNHLCSALPHSPPAICLWDSSEHAPPVNSEPVGTNNEGQGEAEEYDDDKKIPTPFWGSAAFMDLDFGDLDTSWSFDQIPTSPFLVSTSDQPYSPLWAFPDGSNIVAPAAVDDQNNVSGYCNPEPASENRARREEEEGEADDDKKKLPTPFSSTPLDNLDVSFIIKERVTQALRYFKESTGQHQILAQIWAPVRNGDSYMLTTSGQPFVLGSHSNGLSQYRNVSLMYMFPVDGQDLGLPGRVFKQKLPEWTPNVQFYSTKEFPQVRHAKHYNIRGTLALPVIEPSGQSCVGVLELVMASQKINFAPEVDKVCKALEAVNLKSSDILDHLNVRTSNEGCLNALAEVLQVLTEVCETHHLPLAQAWVPCRHCSVLGDGSGLKPIISSFGGSCMGQVCMSTTDVAFYVVDAKMWGFREACTEHHLQKGQGVAGRAFQSRGLCFCKDVSQFSKIDYPLVHYARLFGLTGSFSICLRSKHTGDDDYVLEFFLPPSITDSTAQLKLLDSILVTMKQDQQNLMVSSGRTVEAEKKFMEIVELSMDENQYIEVEPSLSIKPLSVTDSVKGVLPLPNNIEPKLLVDSDGGRILGGSGRSHSTTVFADKRETKQSLERKRGKAENQIDLEVLQQYFSGSLKNAAKTLGVSKSTLKRRCRENGISCWPSSRKKKGGPSVIRSPNSFPAMHPGSELVRPDMMVVSAEEGAGASYNDPDEGLANLASGSRQTEISSTFVVKAVYKEDVIRFHFPSWSTMAKLKKKVSNRLNLKFNEFKIKSLDDDNEWIVLACDSDLQHFLSELRVSGKKTLRLLIHDISR